MMLRRALCLALVASSGALAIGQAPSAPAFEVASVKPNRSGDVGGSLRRQPGGRVDAVNMPLRQLILFAYQLQAFRLVGAPGWVASDRFDIVAKLDGDPPPSLPGAGPDALALAMRTLLAERFKFVAHRETRDMDTYSLVMARPGGSPASGLRRSTQDCAAFARGGPPPPIVPGGALPPVRCGIRQNAGRIEVGGMPLSQFATVLAGQAQVGRVVVDRTDLAGTWDFELTFAWVPPTGQLPPSAGLSPAFDPDATSIFTSLEEQLGLKLESTRGPVDVLVIDSVERPTPD